VKTALTDLAKVIIDYPKQKKTDTGGFLLVHRAKTEIQRPKESMSCDIKITGKSIIPESMKLPITMPGLEVISNRPHNTTDIPPGSIFLPP
jgi:hypothetical protein